MKITIAGCGLVLAFLGGMAAEERMEWRACHALSVFENPAPPAWASAYRSQRKPRPPAPAQLAAK